MISGDKDLVNEIAVPGRFIHPLDHGLAADGGKGFSSEAR
jgi:hypothetical protein